MPNAEDYAWFKSHGICPTCQKYPLIKGKSVCVQCSGAKLEHSVNRWLNLPADQKQADNERRREYQKRRRQKLKESGICTMCGKSPAKQGRTLCALCASKHNRHVAAYTRKKRESQGKDGTPRAMRTSLGLCYICGNPVSSENRNFCAECLKVQRQKAQHMRQFVDYENHPFRELNDAFWNEKKGGA